MNRTTDKVMDLASAVKRFVPHGAHISIGGFTLDRNPMAAVYEMLRQKIRNICGHPRGDDPAPKSRRVWQDEHGAWRPLGWTKIMLVDARRANALKDIPDGIPGDKAVSGGPHGEAAIEKTKLEQVEGRVKPAPAEPETETWEDVHLTWSPGNQQVTAACGTNLAFGLGKELIPAELQGKLFGKRKRAATKKVMVQKVGNAWQIIEIQV